MTPSAIRLVTLSTTFGENRALHLVTPSATLGGPERYICVPFGDSSRYIWVTPRATFGDPERYILRPRVLKYFLLLLDFV